RTSTSSPRFCRCRAMTNPSPPLLPGPHRMSTRSRSGLSRTSNSAAPRPAFSMRTTPGTPNSWIARRSRSRTAARERVKVMARNSKRSTANAESPALDQTLDLGPRQPREVARDRVLERAHRRPVAQALLQVAVEQAVQEAGHEGVAGAEAVDHL